MTPAAAPLFIRRSGTGPPVVLVHGGLPASITWARQHELEAHWSLIIPSRRGYPPSPPAPWQDFLADTDDLTDLVEEFPDGVHLVGFSYGGLSASLTAERLPHRIRSLTLIEVPLWHAAEEDESIQEQIALADRFAASANDTQAETDFFALAGVDRTLLANEEIRQSITLWRNLRSPREAKPRFETITAAAIPTLVVSGAHNPATEHLCDAIATRLNAQRTALPGAGHAAQRAPGFNAILETFLTAAEQRHRSG